MVILGPDGTSRTTTSVTMPNLPKPCPRRSSSLSGESLAKEELEKYQRQLDGIQAKRKPRRWWRTRCRRSSRRFAAKEYLERWPMTDPKCSPGANKLLNVDDRRPSTRLPDYLNAIPRSDVAGQHLPDGTACWCAATSMPSRERRSAKETSACVDARHARLRPAATVGSKSIFGHIGRKPEDNAGQGGQAPGRDRRLRRAAHRRLARRVAHHHPSTGAQTRSPPARRAAILLLENTRRYDIERVLWKAKAGGPAQAGRTAGPAGQRVCHKGRQAST